MTLRIRVDGAARIGGEPVRDETVAVERPVEIASDGPVGLTIEAQRANDRRTALARGHVE